MSDTLSKDTEALRNVLALAKYSPGLSNAELTAARDAIVRLEHLARAEERRRAAIDMHLDALMGSGPTPLKTARVGYADSGCATPREREILRQFRNCAQAFHDDRGNPNVWLIAVRGWERDLGLKVVTLP